MKRSLLLAALAAAAAVGALPAAASATTVELGQSSSSALTAPTCPAGVSQNDCTIVVTRSTALQTVRNGSDYPTTVKQNGEIVAFSVGISRLNTSDTMAHSIVSGLDHSYGGTTQIAMAVLKPVGNKKLFTWSLAAISPVIHIQPYLGTVTQFPLAAPIQVTKGETIAISVPTWAPVLSIGLNTDDYAYRLNRSKGCTSQPTTDLAMFTLNSSDVFGCDYTGVSPQYSATEITTPVPPTDQIHGLNKQERARNRAEERAVHRKATRISRRLAKRGPKILRTLPTGGAGLDVQHPFG